MGIADCMPAIEAMAAAGASGSPSSGKCLSAPIYKRSRRSHSECVKRERSGRIAARDRTDRNDGNEGSRGSCPNASANEGARDGAGNAVPGAAGPFSQRDQRVPPPRA